MGKILKEHEKRIAKLEETSGNRLVQGKSNPNNTFFPFFYRETTSERLLSLETKLDLLIKTLGYELKETPETPAKKEYVKTKK